jgi:hypothetical protein
MAASVYPPCYKITSIAKDGFFHLAGNVNVHHFNIPINACYLVEASASCTYRITRLSVLAYGCNRRAMDVSVG